MAYVKNNWVDREGTTRYFETVDDDGALILTPDYTQVTEMGTPVNADNMNHIEEGIAAGSFTKYDSMATYTLNDLITVIEEGTPTIYKSLQDNNSGNALSDSTYWEKITLGGGGGGHAMFDTVLKDHILTYEESKGLALQGTYVYKEAIAGSRYGYPDFYAKCLEEYNEATTTETVNGVTVKVHSNGHKFYDIANKSAIDNYFNSLGTAWFYGIDTTEERVFLPRNNYFEQMTIHTALVGDSVQAGLPTHTHTRGTMNITGTLKGVEGTSQSATGAFTYSQTAGGYYNNVETGTLGTYTLNASDSWTGSTSTGNYSKALAITNTVQPNAVKKLLYICVGNTVSDTSWVDVVTQVEGGVKDLEDKTLEGIERLKQSSTALTQTQITNCLLEIPQRIKLELNGGTLTLKAGSEVIVPNGFEEDGVTPKFDVVTIESDIQAGGLLESFTDKWVFGYRNNGFYWELVSHCFSGSTLPTQTGENRLGYKTTVNKFQTSTGGGAYIDNICSFPVCIFSTISGAITSIDQVFNGFGYIGSTVWADKGVKGLIPNGRNEDGSLKNIEITLDSIKTTTFDIGRTNTAFAILSNKTLNLVTNLKYIEEDNLLTQPSINTTKYCVPFATGTTDSTGRITEYKNVKLPFRAVDYNDYQKLTKAYIIATYVNGTSWYRVWSDGWIEQGGILTNSGSDTGQSTIALLKPFSNTNYSVQVSWTNVGTQSPATAWIGCLRSKTTSNFIINKDEASWISQYTWEAKGY